jgi:hypothetical protein
MSGVIRNFIRKYIVAEDPNDMNACLDCKIVQCTADEYATCAHRLARAATLDHLRAVGECGNPPDPNA